jgi:hypothetical protein
MDMDAFDGVLADLILTYGKSLCILTGFDSLMLGSEDDLLSA